MKKKEEFSKILLRLDQIVDENFKYKNFLIVATILK